MIRRLLGYSFRVLSALSLVLRVMVARGVDCGTSTSPARPTIELNQRRFS
jgi:hypothetical protein